MAAGEGTEEKLAQVLPGGERLRDGMRGEMRDERGERRDERGARREER